MKTAQKTNTMTKYIPYFIKGVGYTIVITIFSVLIGIILGMLLALMRLSKNKLLHWIAVCYIEFIRGTPQMVQILFVYFGVGALISNLSAVVAGDYRNWVELWCLRCGRHSFWYCFSS